MVRGGGGAATSRRRCVVLGVVGSCVGFGLGARLRGVWSLSVDVFFPFFFFLFFFSSGCFTITIIFGPSKFVLGVGVSLLVGWIDTT